MDIQQKVAARRAELAKEEADRKSAKYVEKAKREEALAEQRKQAVAGVAKELSTAYAPVIAEGEELRMALPLPPLDVEGLRKSQIERLLKREARKRWSPSENWLVIGSIVGGITFLHIGFLGFIPLLFGLWFRSIVNKRYRNRLLKDYPHIFD